MIDKVVRTIETRAIQGAAAEANRHLDLLVEWEQKQKNGGVGGGDSLIPAIEGSRAKASTWQDVAVLLGGETARTKIVENCGGIDIFGNEYGALTAADIVESRNRRAA